MKPPMTPTKHTDTILLVPMGTSFSEGVAASFLKYLVHYCMAFFTGMTVEVLDKPLLLANARKRENDFNHDQYLIADLFEALHTETRSHRKAYCRLGITMEDIYPGEEWNYVFGQAKPMERVGVLLANLAHSTLALQTYEQQTQECLIRKLITAGRFSAPKSQTTCANDRAHTHATHVHKPSGVFSFARHSPFFYNGLHASQVLFPAEHA